MPEQSQLIIQVPSGGPVERSLAGGSSLAGGEVVVVALPTDDAGNLDSPDQGEVVMSVLSPEALSREPEEIRRIIGRAGTGPEPLVIVVEAAEELRDEELAAVVEAARHTDRAVILRILRNV